VILREQNYFDCWNHNLTEDSIAAILSFFRDGWQHLPCNLDAIDRFDSLGGWRMFETVEFVTKVKQHCPDPLMPSPLGSERSASVRQSESFENGWSRQSDCLPSEIWIPSSSQVWVCVPEGPLNDGVVATCFTFKQIKPRVLPPRRSFCGSRGSMSSKARTG